MKRLTILDDNKEEIINLYTKDKLSTRDIGKLFGVEKFMISKRLTEWEVKKRTRSELSTKHTIDKYVFDIITEESAYWIGFLMADGYVSNNTFGVALKDTDKNHVDKFKTFLKSSHSTYFTKDNMYGIAIKNTYISEALKKHNVIPRKSLIAQAPDYLLNNRDFWRGMVDGDGSIWNTQGYPNICLAGSIGVVKPFKKYCESIVDNIASNIQSKKTIFMFRTNGKKAQKVISNLYKDAVISLDRKQELANKYMI